MNRIIKTFSIITFSLYQAYTAHGMFNEDLSHKPSEQKSPQYPTGMTAEELENARKSAPKSLEDFFEKGDPMSASEISFLGKTLPWEMSSDHSEHFLRGAKEGLVGKGLNSRKPTQEEVKKREILIMKYQIEAQFIDLYHNCIWAKRTGKLSPNATPEHIKFYSFCSIPILEASFQNSQGQDESISSDLFCFSRLKHKKHYYMQYSSLPEEIKVDFTKSPHSDIIFIDKEEKQEITEKYKKNSYSLDYIEKLIFPSDHMMQNKGFAFEPDLQVSLHNQTYTWSVDPDLHEVLKPKLHFSCFMFRTNLSEEESAPLVYHIQNLVDQFKHEMTYWPKEKIESLKGIRLTVQDKKNMETFKIEPQMAH